MADVLLLGCGNNRTRRLAVNGKSDFSNDNLVTIDNDPDTCPTHLFDLNQRPLPMEAGSMDEIHAYEVLEHIGRQGDVEGFFKEFQGYWEILRPGGALIGSVPAWDSQWAWGDPGHTRVIPPGTFAFLSQAEYEGQVGKTNMSDYRRFWPQPYDFRLEFLKRAGDQFYFMLRKPNA